MNQIEKLKKEIERLKNEERSNLDEAPKRKFRRVSNWMKEAKYEAEHADELLNEGLEELHRIREEKNLEEAALTKEIAHFALNAGTGDNTPTIGEIARHFYELGKNAK